MKLTLPEIIIFIIIITVTLKSIKDSFLNRSLYYVKDSIIGSVSSILSFFIMFSFYNYFYEKISIFLFNVYNGERFLVLFKLISFIIIFWTIKCIIYFILSFVDKIFFSFEIGGESSSQKVLLVTLSSFLGVLRGFLIVVCIFIAMIFYNGLVDKKFEINFFENLNVYNKISAVIDNKTVNKIKNGLFEDDSLNTIVYYNGVTLEEGVASNEVIYNKAKELTRGLKTNREKAKEIYKWVGSNIQYDYKKAENIENSISKKSGAIAAFDERKGICFDYACLFAAMCKANDIKVRIIIGEAYNGYEYISHAWNQVYLKNEGKWINVDPTFYSAGDYFDNKDFYKDHKEKNIAGEL